MNSNDLKCTDCGYIGDCSTFDVEAMDDYDEHPMIVCPKCGNTYLEDCDD